MSPRAPAREGPAACRRRRESTRASRQGRNLDRPKIGQDRLPRDGSGFLLSLKVASGSDRHPDFERYCRWRCHRALDMDSPAIRPVQGNQHGHVVAVGEAGGLYRRREARRVSDRPGAITPVCEIASPERHARDGPRDLPFPCSHCRTRSRTPSPVRQRPCRELTHPGYSGRRLGTE